MPGFTDYFNENMSSLGVPTPAGLYGSVATALSSAGTIAGAIKLFGPDVTVRELIGAGTLTEEFAYAGALQASFYLGAVVGSIAVATGRVLGGGARIADLFSAVDAAPLEVISEYWPAQYAAEYSAAVSYSAEGTGGSSGGDFGGDGGYGGGDPGGGEEPGGGDPGGGGGGGGGGFPTHPEEDAVTPRSPGIQVSEAAPDRLVQSMASFAVPGAGAIASHPALETTKPMLAHVH
ncbi:hypothetical protein [Duganella hordei]|uniref:hypothetical protein n=1 Tax=Duganella hordei TaxID=2865934 RepID=UPI0030E7FE7B